MRRTIPSILVTLLALALPAGSTHAANYTDTAYGVSMEVDDALTRGPTWRDIRFFTSEDNSASLMIKHIYDLSVTDFLDELSDVGYRDRRDGIDLRINGRPLEADVENGRGLLIPVGGWISGQNVRGVVGAYSGHDGQGVLVFGTAKPAYWASWEPRMRKMFESVRLVAIDNNAIVAKWEKRLKGKTLEYKQANLTSSTTGGTVVGGAEHRDYNLCSDGSLVRASGSSGQYAGPYMSFYSSSSSQSAGGDWFVIVQRGKPYLVVRDGRKDIKLMLEDVGDTFLLDGRPYVIKANDKCK